MCEVSGGRSPSITALAVAATLAAALAGGCSKKAPAEDATHTKVSCTKQLRCEVSVPKRHELCADATYDCFEDKGKWRIAVTATTGGPSTPDEVKRRIESAVGKGTRIERVVALGPGDYFAAVVPPGYSAVREQWRLVKGAEMVCYAFDWDATTLEQLGTSCRSLQIPTRR